MLALAGVLLFTLLPGAVVIAEAMPGTAALQQLVNKELKGTKQAAVAVGNRFDGPLPRVHIETASAETAEATGEVVLLQQQRQQHQEQHYRRLLQVNGMKPFLQQWYQRVHQLVQKPSPQQQPQQPQQQVEDAAVVGSDDGKLNNVKDIAEAYGNGRDAVSSGKEATARSLTADAEFSNFGEDAGDDSNAGDGGGDDGTGGDDEEEGISAAAEASTGAAKEGAQRTIELNIIPDLQGEHSVRQSLMFPPRCVFILGTGRSGSTSLQDAINQLPNYLIRGEHKGSFYHLFKSWRLLGESQESHALYLQRLPNQAEIQEGSAWPAYDTVKQLYNTYAVRDKLPWFNDMHRVRLAEAARAYYALTYGYHGPDVVSGFKEIRYNFGRPGLEPLHLYEDFIEFLGFLRMLCRDVKFLLNSRKSYKAEDNHKLAIMRDLKNLTSFEEEMKVTHEWYDRYVKEHPKVAFRVLMEDMFNPKVNATLAHKLLQFLGEDPLAHNISFARMPTWSKMKSTGSV